CFFFQAEDGIRDRNVTGVQTCALPISTMSISSLGLSCSASAFGPCCRKPVAVRFANRSASELLGSKSPAICSRTKRLNGLSSFRSEEHTSELQSRFDLVCRLLLEKKKI